MEYLELGDKSGHLLPGEEPLREQEALDPIIPKTGEGEGAEQGDFGGTNTTPEGTQTGNQKRMELPPLLVFSPTSITILVERKCW